MQVWQFAGFWMMSFSWPMFFFVLKYLCWMLAIQTQVYSSKRWGQCRGYTWACREGASLDARWQPGYGNLGCIARGASWTHSCIHTFPSPLLYCHCVQTLAITYSLPIVPPNPCREYFTVAFLWPSSLQCQNAGKWGVSLVRVLQIHQHMAEITTSFSPLSGREASVVRSRRAFVFLQSQQHGEADSMQPCDQEMEGASSHEPKVAVAMHNTYDHGWIYKSLQDCNGREWSLSSKQQFI